MGEFRRGDFVFVFPTEPDAPREVRGLAGVVKKIRGTRATVVWRNDENASDLHFLPKPFGLKQLAAKVKEVLAP